MASFPKIMQTLGGAFGASAKVAKTAPTLAAAGGLYGASFLADIGSGGVRAAGNSMGMGSGPIDMEAARFQYAKERSELFQRKQEAIELQLLRQDVANNAAALASSSPHLYNQLMAGRRLPQGATVLGGVPRTDLLEELAFRMAQGQTMSAPPDMPSEYVDFNDLIS